MKFWGGVHKLTLILLTFIIGRGMETLSQFLQLKHPHCFRVFSFYFILGIHTLLRKSIKKDTMAKYLVDINKIIFQLLTIIIWEKLP